MPLYAPAHITSIPGAITFLASLFATTCPTDANNEPITIWLGAELGVFAAPTTIEINGADPVDRQWASLGPNYMIEENYSIKCKLSSFIGEGSALADFLTVMTSTWAVWEALEVGLMVDPTLGGNVRVCWFDETIYEPSTDAMGRAMAVISWVIKCEARVTTLS